MIQVHKHAAFARKKCHQVAAPPCRAEQKYQPFSKRDTELLEAMTEFLKQASLGGQSGESRIGSLSLVFLERM